MDSLGAMLDYAVNSCDEPLALFWDRFIASGAAAQIERRNPRYLCGMSGIELACTVASRTGKSLNEAKPVVDMGSPEYWTGWALAYIQCQLGKSFRQMEAAGVGATQLYSRYPTLHEADLTKSLAFASTRFDIYRQQCSPLARLRKATGLTQNGLANLSGLSLRSIRAYEQGQLQLASASAESLFRLAQALGCSPEDLMI